MKRHNIWNEKASMGNAAISILETTDADFGLKLAHYLKGEAE